MARAIIDTVGVLSQILQVGWKIQVECQKCGEYHRFTRAEIEALAGKVGAEFNLLNRRCRCRLTPGCQGWNRFFFCAGVYRPLFTPEQSARWSDQDRRERMGLPPDSRGGK